MSIFDGMSDIFMTVFSDNNIAVYAPRNAGVEFQIPVIFNPYYTVYEVDENGVTVEITATVAHIRKSDYASPKQEDMLEIDGRTYVVIGVKDDRKGMIVLMLKRA